MRALKLKALAMMAMTSSVFFGSEVLARNPTPAIAQVSLVVGAASITRADGQSVAIERGLSVYENDRLVTGEDGMVMLVFLDEGRMALRPGSELLIRKYQYDAAGLDSDLKLELVKGTVRQISGKAAKQQPERYRLNTPVAVIGVRGTDFLAKADESSVRTYVHEGAIAVSSKQLSQPPVLSKAGEGNFLMAQAEGRLEQHPLKIAELDQSFGIRLAASTAKNEGVATAQKEVHVSEVRDSTTVAATSATVQATELLEKLTNQRPEPSPGGEAGLSPSPGVGSDNPFVDGEKLPSKLVWGRSLNDPQALPLALPLPYVNASLGRSATVGEPLAYTLWREGASGVAMNTGLVGVANFALAAGEGHYTSSSGSMQPVTMSDARLQVNFDRSQFNTGMTLNSAGLPSQQLQVSGTINTDGIFLGKTPNQRVAGALSLDGTEAGYLFQLDASGGAYKGITLWNKK